MRRVKLFLVVLFLHSFGQLLYGNETDEVIFSLLTSTEQYPDSNTPGFGFVVIENYYEILVPDHLNGSIYLKPEKVINVRIERIWEGCVVDMVLMDNRESFAFRQLLKSLPVLLASDWKHRISEAATALHKDKGVMVEFLGGRNYLLFAKSSSSTTTFEHPNLFGYLGAYSEYDSELQKLRDLIANVYSAYGRGKIWDS